MAYTVTVSCDKCGCGFVWTDFTINKSSAVRYARKEGWMVGKLGWYCKDCRKTISKEKR